jgi:glycosyltransferase involved in cell wall biosynthesis
MGGFVIIAYDLRYAADHFTGIGTHAYSLLTSLLDLPGDERYAVLWNPELQCRRYDLDAIASHSRVRWFERRFGALDVAGMARIGSWLRQLRPAVYVSPFYLKPAFAPCPCLLTLHDVWPLRLPGLSALRRMAFRASLAWAARATGILTSSEFSRAEIVRVARIPEERVHAIRLGVPSAGRVLGSRRPAGVPDGRFALVVGDNRPRKNLRTLAQAWACMNPEPALGLVAAGPVDRRYPSLPELATRAGARRVTGVGWVEEAELQWLLDHAELVLFPSLYEGFGFPLLEAFAKGRPALAAAIPALLEIGKGAALFVEPQAPEAWAAAVGRLESDPTARERLTQAGRVRAGELSYRTTAQRTLSVLRQAAQRDLGRHGMPREA